MSKKCIWLSAITLVLALVHPSFACMTKSKHTNAHQRLEQIEKELDLTADQKAQIKEYKKQAHASFKANYMQLRTLQNQIAALVKADNIDEAKLDVLVEQVNKIKGAMLKARIMMQHQMYTLLNDKQKAKFIELKKQWYEQHKA